MKSKNNWIEYQNNRYDCEPNELLLKLLKEYNINTAIDIGAGSGNETVCLAKNNVNVIAIDQVINKDNYINRLNVDEMKHVQFIESDFDNVCFSNVDLICAFFSIPFSKKFNDLWNKIVSSINTNGFFVGEIFGNRHSWVKTKPNINFHTKNETLELFEKFELIYFKEIEYDRKIDNIHWHYFDIIARKNK